MRVGRASGKVHFGCHAVSKKTVFLCRRQKKGTAANPEGCKSDWQRRSEEGADATAKEAD